LSTIYHTFPQIVKRKKEGEAPKDLAFSLPRRAAEFTRDAESFQELRNLLNSPLSLRVSSSLRVSA
jgi:hypothetical protein